MKVHESMWLEIAARQHGAISHAQLLDAGLTSRQARLRVASGLLVRVHRGVFRLTSSPDTFEQAAMTACLATGGVASHRSAAALWELRGCEPGPVDVTVAARRSPELVGVVGHTTAGLLTVDVTERWAVPVTTPARTLIDLAAVAPRHLVEGALEDALHRKLVSVSWLERTLCIPSSRGRPGTGVVAELLTGRGDAAATESVLEDLLVQLLRDAGLPEPTRQHRVSVPGHGSVRIDVAFVPELVAIEGQGLASHSSGRDLQRDCDKRNLLVRLGWRVLAFTWRDVRYRPELVVVTVRSALAA